jgi:hypothetical protein
MLMRVFLVVQIFIALRVSCYVRSSYLLLASFLEACTIDSSWLILHPQPCDPILLYL